MFTTLALYFAYRRDVVLAERHVAGLAQTPSTARTAAAHDDVQQTVAEQMRLAA